MLLILSEDMTKVMKIRQMQNNTNKLVLIIRDIRALNHVLLKASFWTIALVNSGQLTFGLIT